MALVTANDVTVVYGAQDVFDDISFSLSDDACIALIGPNGSGKSSLLRCIAGREPPFAGTITRRSSIAIGYLPQEPDIPGERTLFDEMRAVFIDLQEQADELRRLEHAMADGADGNEGMLARYGRLQEAFERAGGYTYESKIRRVLGGLGFSEEDSSRPVEQLSGGEQTRALLARLLLQEPDLLLLDEPTNHLDIQTIEWLEEYLREWAGAMVIVAHDRAFLDALADEVWELFAGRLEQYPGNYTTYRELRDERLTRRRKEYEKQQAFIEKEKEYIRRNIAGQNTKQAQGRRTRLQRMERLERPHTYEPPSFVLESSGRSGEVVLGLYDVTVGYTPAEPLFTCEGAFEIRRGECVALVGRNGVGKTTLLKTALGTLPPIAGEVHIGSNVNVGYFSQTHAELDPDKTILDQVMDTTGVLRDDARDFLGRYHFSGDDVFKRIGDVSGGERARTALAILALQDVNVLILDEPTNHLDIQSQEALQETLTEFGGTMLLVTHDRYLIRGIDSRVWAITHVASENEGGELLDFPAGYDAYHDWIAAQREEQRAQTAARHRRRRVRNEEQRQAEQEARRRAQHRAELEARINTLESELATLGEQLEVASKEGDVDNVRRLGQEYAGVEEQLEASMAEWMRLAGSE